jgi:NADH dehydrogenase [ubiquinone] 1 alpha subcomplex assembly factor 7
MSALRALITAEIRENGPISVAHYMEMCLAHPHYGYYMTRDPLGLDGDFITAPEISQMFGEVIGLWAAHLWQMMGAPNPVQLIELGPGRGTLMKDMLRAARLVPGFHAAIQVHFIEMSPVLRQKQKANMAGFDIQFHWHDHVSSVPDGPALIIANEFFDALPIHQYMRMSDGWRERLIGLDAEGRLCFGLAGHAEVALSEAYLNAPIGTIIEISKAVLAVMQGIATRIAAHGGAALIIDYGHMGHEQARSGSGDTFQAVRQHQYRNVLEEPGEADLTAHVDFASLQQAARQAGAKVHGPVTQGAFLSEIGLLERAAILKRSASLEQEMMIDAAIERLISTDADHMGALFKVLAVTDQALALHCQKGLAGFSTPMTGHIAL